MWKDMDVEVDVDSNADANVHVRAHAADEMKALRGVNRLGLLISHDHFRRSEKSIVSTARLRHCHGSTATRGCSSPLEPKFIPVAGAAPHRLPSSLPFSASSFLPGCDLPLIIVLAYARAEFPTRSGRM